jgi:hypothetical protein
VGTLKDELKKAAAELAIVPPYEPPPRPANAPDVTVEGLWHAYSERLANISVKDPRGEFINFKEENFPYLVKLEFWNKKANKWFDAVAGVVIQQLKDKTFDATLYRIGDLTRARTLFWTKDILEGPDCIHENNNAGMTDKEIYVMRYEVSNPDDAEVKVVLVAERPDEGKIKVTSSSFWTDQRWLRKAAKQPPLYVRPNSKGCRCR